MRHDVMCNKWNVLNMLHVHVQWWTTNMHVLQWIRVVKCQICKKSNFLSPNNLFMFHMASLPPDTFYVNTQRTWCIFNTLVQLRASNKTFNSYDYSQTDCQQKI